MLENGSFPAAMEYFAKKSAALTEYFAEKSEIDSKPSNEDKFFSENPDFAFGMPDNIRSGLSGSGTDSKTVFPSVQLTEILCALTDAERDGLIQSLGEGRRN